MDLATLIFCDYVTSITRRHSMKRKENLPQLNQPYITVQLSGFTPVAHDVSDNVWAEDKPTPDPILDEEGNDIAPANTDDEIIRGLNIIEFTVEALGGHAANALARLQASFESAQFIFGLEAYGFGLSEKGQATNTTALLLEGEMEERWEIKTSFYFCASEKFEAVWFNKELIRILIENYDYDKSFEGSENPLNCIGGICESYQP
jgi:hypothetical protein